MPPDGTPIASHTPEAALSALHSQTAGLGAAEVQRRLRAFGPNQVERLAGEPVWLTLLREFTHFFALVLWLAAGLAFAAEHIEPGQGMAELGVAIVGVILVNGGFSFWQAYRAEQALDALRRLLPQRVKVRRDGRLDEIDAAGLVPGDVVSLGGSGNLLVRVALSPEQDATADGPETFKLVATNTSKTASTGGLGTIMDDGTGGYFAADNTTATPALPAGIVLDDDRVLTVSDVTVNEGSPYAVFMVTGAAGQKATLSLANQNIDGNDLSALQYFDGSTWQPYVAGSLVTLNDAGKLLVRVALQPEQEFVLDGPEVFTLVATNTGGAVSTGGQGAINDDGTGAYFAEDNNSADSALPPGVILDDDKPVPPPQNAAQPPVVAAPPAVELPVPEVRVYIPEIPPVTRGSVEPVKELPSLTVTNQIPEQYVDSGARSGFAIPSDAFAHSDPTEVLQLSAMQANGLPLPGWIRFDASSGTFQVDAPAGYAGELRLMIRARDSKGNEVSSIFRFNVGKKREAERQPASRPSCCSPTGASPG